jgi:transcriptional regulator GlxA family with amidase domain
MRASSVEIDIIRGKFDMKEIEVLVLEGAMSSGVAITYDMLDTANRLLAAKGQGPAFAVHTSGSGSKTRGAGRPPGDIPDVLIIPGLGFTSESAIAEGLARADMADARQRLAKVAARGTEIAASCSATFLLADTGLLDRRRATTTWWLAPIFRRRFPAVELDADAVIVADGPVITAGAAMAQIDLMLTLIARHAGPTTADGCARYMLLDHRRSQTPYVALGLLAAADERVARAEAWARPRLEQAIAVDQLAAAAALAPRTFARRLERVTGLSPVRFLQRLRLERAIELVHSTRLPIEEIARRVGYAEPSTLRRLFRREGHSARALRVGHEAAA